MTVHHGTTVTLTARQAAMLVTFGDLSRLRLRNQHGTDPELADLLSSLASAANAHRVGSAGATGISVEPATVAPSVLMSPKQAADRLGITPAAVRRAIEDDRLTAVKVDGRWQISEADLAAYSPRVANSSANPAGLAIKHLIQARAENVGLDQLLAEMSEAGLQFAAGADNGLPLSEVGMIVVHESEDRGPGSVA